MIIRKQLVKYRWNWHLTGFKLPSQVCMTCRLRCSCCASTQPKSTEPGTGNLLLRIPGLGRLGPTEPEITRLDLLPPNFVESHFGNLIKTSSPGTCRDGELVSIKTLFSSSSITRPNKLEGLSLKILSNQVLEFEGKAWANPIGAPFRCFLLG